VIDVQKPGRTISDLPANTVTVLGAPLDENCTFMRGPVEGPGQIREALHSRSSNMCAENGLDLHSDDRWRDVGDLALHSGLEAFREIEEAVAGLIERQARVVTLGGDHSITLPLIRAHARFHHGLTLLQLDAHPDLYDSWEGNRYSHCCPFARIMEEKLVGRLVQIGVRTATPHQREQAERFGVEIIEMNDWRPDMPLYLKDPLYISLDLDCLDPAFAPGVSHYEPGGFSVRDVLAIIRNLPVPPIGADIVELNPRRDPEGITAAVGAKLLKEIVARMLG
jgi:agmatinase